MTQVARSLGDSPDADAGRAGAPLALGVIIVASTIVQLALALRSPSPWIIPDELIYSELARSLGNGGSPMIRDELAAPVGFGYPVLLAPIWAVFDEAATAYTAARVLNALVLSATAVPVYFLARRFVHSSYALVVAALSVAVPSLLYSGTLMTEVALYPAFVTALLGITVAVERPTVGTQIAALVAIGLACTVKMLAAVLVPAYVAAIVLYHWLELRDGPRWRGRMREYVPTLLSLALITLVSGVLGLALGRRPQDALGAYSVVLDNVDLLSTPWWALLHVAEFDLYLAVIPFAATIVVAARGLRPSAKPSERLLLALGAPASAALFLAVAAFASTPYPGGPEYPENVSRLHERSTFVLAPLFLIGLAMTLRDRRHRLAVLAAVVAGAALLPALIPIDDFDRHVRFQALALVPWVELRDDVGWPIGLLLFTFVLGLSFVAAMRAKVSSGAVLAPIVFVFLAVGLTAHVSMREASEWTRSVAWGTAPDWIDAAVGSDAEVSVLWAESPGQPFVNLLPRHYPLFVGEFFNRSIGQVFEIGSPLPYDLPSTPVRLEHRRVLLEDGTPAPVGRLVLAPCHVRVVGTPVARDTSTGAVVYRVRQPIRAEVTSPASCAQPVSSAAP